MKKVGQEMHMATWQLSPISQPFIKDFEGVDFTL